MGKILIIFMLFFFACNNTQPDLPTVRLGPLENFFSGADCHYQIVEIDSCEYIYVMNSNASWGSHKGNCKFCAERVKR
jgi:hypothetical protein